MGIVKVLRGRPELFFRLCGIRPEHFDALLERTYRLWEESEHKRLGRKDRQRGIGGGMKYRLDFSEQVLLCLMYYRSYTTHVFLGLLFNVSSPTVCRRINAMTVLLAVISGCRNAKFV